MSGPDAFAATSGGRRRSGHALTTARGVTSTQVLAVACGDPLGGANLVARGAIGTPWRAVALPRPLSGEWTGASGAGCTAHGLCRTGDPFDHRGGQDFPDSLAGSA